MKTLPTVITDAELNSTQIVQSIQIPSLIRLGFILSADCRQASSSAISANESVPGYEAFP